MSIGIEGLQALIAAAVMAGFYVAVSQPWVWRIFIALWIPLAILIFIILHGPIVLG